MQRTKSIVPDESCIDTLILTYYQWIANTTIHSPLKRFSLEGKDSYTKLCVRKIANYSLPKSNSDLPNRNTNH